MQIEPQKEISSHKSDQPEALTLPSKTGVPKKKTASSWIVLRNRNYSLLFWGQLVSAAGTQMQVVAVAWQVYLLTHSAIALGLIGLFQAIPRLLFSLVGGSLQMYLTGAKCSLSLRSPWLPHLRYWRCVRSSM